MPWWSRKRLAPMLPERCHRPAEGLLVDQNSPTSWRLKSLAIGHDLGELSNDALDT
jgi:hypothetical protein